ncbi:MAG TPA: phage holin family protein [Steroidobacteraceae bacterium]|nr:phage holin family protein [Steroidobacteraceae bacterium]
MTEESATDDVTEQEHPTGVFRSLVASVLAAARTRLDLAAVETEIFLLRAVRMLLWALAALACGLLALAFAVVALVAALWDTHRMLGVLGGAGLFVILAAVCAFIAARTFRQHPPLLSGTLAQLESDAHQAGGSP